MAILSAAAISEAATYTSPYGNYKEFADFGHYPRMTAGKYQIVPDTYELESAKLGLNDFTIHTQNLISADPMLSTGTVSALQQGDLAKAINDASRIWSLIPLGSGDLDHSIYPYSTSPHKGQPQPSMHYSDFIKLSILFTVSFY